MTYVKKLVMHGFKSFVKKTEIPFTPEINVVLGPNGSGKSNVADALCFVLGRLSIKSMRAAKAKNLIFMGSKVASPAKEASVEIVFDNSHKTFSVEGNEVSIKRIVRRNGQSIYKINNHTKTRTEVLSLLAQAGIDPYGFNIILQGEIQNFVRMHTEERRKVIEEVSGIAIYETRKQKSLKELEKTEEKLKEVKAILKERTAYLNNLEKERQQALRYKKLEKDIKKFKASILVFDKNKNLKELSFIEQEIQKKNKKIENVKKSVVKVETEVKNLESNIVSINSTISKSAGIEQEKLNSEITNLRADLAGIDVNIENNEKKLSQLDKQKSDFKQTIESNQEAIKSIKKESGKKVAKKDKEIELEKKQRHLDSLEEKRKELYMARSELRTSREKLNEKNMNLSNYNSEAEFLLKQIRSISKEIFDKSTTQSKIDRLRVSLSEKKQLLNSLRVKEIELGKISYNNESEIERQHKLVEKISAMDICPLCKSKITEKHILEIKKEISPKIDQLKIAVTKSDRDTGEIQNKIEVLNSEIENFSSEIMKRESDLLKIASAKEKEKSLRIIEEKIRSTELELKELNKKIEELDNKLQQNSDIESRYETLRLEIQEMSVLDEDDLDSEILFRKRELERAKIAFKQIEREKKEIGESLKELIERRKFKQDQLDSKNRAERELSKKFEKLISRRESMSRKIRAKESELSSWQMQIHSLESEIGNIRIEKARIGAIIENIESELLEFSGIQIVRMPRNKLTERLARTQETFQKIGTVNMRSLEVYEEIKKEYESIQTKVETIENEKSGIMKIIHQIDVKKKKTFLKILNELNEIFSKNFSQLSTKGRVYLELENRKEPFEGGVNIIVKTGHGKYFDVTSLSGGEQTIVALSLIFAIQELNPYAFYILDEIDAALDKRNSERLANLLKKYMEKGQYIVISHNDEVIDQASVLYGISMHDGVSKIISMKV